MTCPSCPALFFSFIRSPLGLRRPQSTLQPGRQAALAPNAGTLVPSGRLPSRGPRFSVRLGFQLCRGRASLPVLKFHFDVVFF